ncbi:hypothetical protein Bca4012_088466 [Brassica carinata]
MKCISSRLQFYHVDVNGAPFRLVFLRKNQFPLWIDNQKQAEVIGGHKAHFAVNEVREMIENDSIS